jgi:Tol biopolymer transport system component
VLGVLGWLPEGALAQAPTTLISVSASAVQGNGHSGEPAASATGRFVAFQSLASNLVAGDTNGSSDIFLRDQQTGGLSRVSVSTGGGQSNGASHVAQISADGRWVVFGSTADNLVAGDTGLSIDCFHHDRLTTTTIRVSVSSAGVEGNADSVVGGANEPACVVSDDGQVVAFVSSASNLVAGDTNFQRDIFVRDVAVGITARVSVATGGQQASGISRWPTLSGDGRLVAFASTAPDLVPGDTNAASDVFVHDRQTGETTRISLGAGAVEGNGSSSEPWISSDGRYVAFSSDASNLVGGDNNGVADVFIRDLDLATTVRVSLDSSGGEANQLSNSPRISAGGSIVLFRSIANNLVAGDTNGKIDIFMHSLLTGETTLVSTGPSASQGNAPCDWPALTRDGRAAMFETAATTLVPADTNGKNDAFSRLLSSWSSVATGLPGISGVPGLGGAGTLVAGGSASLDLSGAAPSASCMLFVSLSSSPVPFKGGTLYAFPSLVQIPLVTNAGGSLSLPFVWPSGVPPYVEFFFQYAIEDAAAVKGVSLSNSLSGMSG